jgi:glycosyltransferase involved in cell wall biosynthesis
MPALQHKGSPAIDLGPRLTMERAKRIVMLANSGHRASDPRVFQKEARFLARAGFDVTLIVPHDKDEQVEGVSILGVPRYTKGWGKLIRSPWLVYRRALTCPRDSIFHLHDSELLWIGILLKLRGRKLLYDAHEDTPRQISYQHWIPKFFRKPFAWFYYLLEKLCGWWFDAIIVAEPVIAGYFPKSKTTLIRNFPIFSQFPEPSHPYQSRSKKIVYVGLLSRPRGAVEMAESARLLKAGENFTMTFAGNFSPDSLRDEILSNYPVGHIPWMEFPQMVALLMDARAGMIVAHPIERYNTNYPVKTFEYMAASLPVIASKFGESAKFLQEANAGILVDPLSPNEIADAIQWILDHPGEAAEMGKRGRKLISEKYTWEEEAKTLISLYEKLTST